MNKTVAIKGMEVGSPEWRELRKTHLGASEIGSVLGVNPWASPVDVWLEKMGRQEPFAGNNATKWGVLLEDLVAQEYGKMVGKRVRRYGYTLVNGVFMGDLDRLVHDEGTLPAVKDDIRTNRAMDAKTARDKSLWSDGLPAHYEAQGFLYMFLAPALDLVDFATLFMAEREMEVYPLVRDDETITAMVEQAQAWWDRHIVGHTAPDPISEADCKALWGRHRPDSFVVATEEVVSDLALLNSMCIAEKEFSKSKEDVRMRIMAAMQDAEALKSPDGKVVATWKSNKDTAKVDWEAVAKALNAPADLVEMFTVVKPGARVFRIKE